MTMLLKEIDRIEALAENKRDSAKLANFWKMYALELRDQAQAEKAELVRQCAEIAMNMPTKADEIHAYRSTDDSKAMAWDIHHAILSLLPKE